jgi:rhodanese-related sulfurtransferase
MKRLLVFLAVSASTPLAAAPQVSGDGACGVHAVDNASFVSCDGERAPAAIGDDTSLPAALSVDATGAWTLLRDFGHRLLFVDIRSRPEVLMAGQPRGIHAHVPFMQPDPNWEVDPRSGRARMAIDTAFLPRLDEKLAAAGLGHGDPVILICRSGERSLLAAELLREHGYLQVFVVRDGFEGRLVDDDTGGVPHREGGWKQAGLPWKARFEAFALAAAHGPGR